MYFYIYARMRLRLRRAVDEHGPTEQTLLFSCVCAITGDLWPPVGSWCSQEWVGCADLQACTTTRGKHMKEVMPYHREIHHLSYYSCVVHE